MRVSGSSVNPTKTKKRDLYYQSIYHYHSGLIKKIKINQQCHYFCLNRSYFICPPCVTVSWPFISFHGVSKLRLYLIINCGTFSQNSQMWVHWHALHTGFAWFCSCSELNGFSEMLHNVSILSLYSGQKVWIKVLFLFFFLYFKLILLMDISLRV